MSAVKFEQPTSEMIQFIAETMRREDVVEVWAVNYLTPKEALLKSVDMSKACTTVIVDGVPIAMLGVTVTDVLTHTGAPWLLSSEHALKHKRLFLELTKPVIEEMLEICPRLVNYVHVDNRLSIRWLKWMGFTIEDPIRIPLTGGMFHRFYLER